MNMPFRTLRFILSHPLNRKHRVSAFIRYVAWQLGSRLLPGPVAIRFVNDSRLLMSPGMTGATGNLYCGLHEFEDMAFVLHALRPEDRFIDVGANIGSYSILAAAAGCKDCISIEPAPSTYSLLQQNVAINGYAGLIRAVRMGAGATDSCLRFTSGLDTMNHVVADDEAAVSTIAVEVHPLDAIVGPLTSPTVMKIDVEGYETEVVAGAPLTLQSPHLIAVVMELNGSGVRYGYDEDALHRTMLEYGFTPMVYEPFSRLLTRLPAKNVGHGNTIYIRNLDLVARRVAEAPLFQVWNGSI